MKGKKIASIVLSVAMITSMLAGCGSGNAGGGETKAKDTPAATEAKTETTAPETTAPADDETPAAATGDELVYWSMWDAGSPQANAIQEIIDEYTAKTGVKVNVQWKGRDINKVIQAALDAKNDIDLFDEDFQRVGTQYASSCLDLEDMAKAADYDNHAVAALPTAIRGWAGSLKGIAYQPYTSGIFYNKAIFKEAGIESEPQTWAEFLDCCEKIKAAGYNPLALDDAYVLYNLGYHMARYIGQEKVSNLCKYGAYEAEDGSLVSWKDSKEVLQAVQDLVDFVKAGYLEENAPDAYPASENTIGYDETAMVVNASWVPGEITNNTGCDLEWGMFNYPSIDGGADPNTIANVGAQAFAIPAYSDKAQEAFDLIMMITTGEGDQKIALATDSIPADPTNSQWPEMIAGCKDGFNALTNVYDWNCGLNDNADLQPIIKENILKVFEGALDAQGFIDAVTAAAPEPTAPPTDDAAGETTAETTADTAESTTETTAE